MILTNKLKAIFAEHNASQADVARLLGIAPKTMYEKMSRGVFGSDEIQIMIDEFNIENPVDIFFAKEVS